MKAVWIALALVLGACRTASPPAEVRPPVVAEATPTRPAPELPAEHGLRTVERWVGGAQPGDPNVPVIVVVHGLGDSPDHFAWAVESFPDPARIVLPAGPTPFGRGFAWMTIRTSEGRDEALAAQIDASAARVAALCRDLGREGKKPILTGFSQGGMISWAVAVRHPETISAAFPVGGYLSPILAPPKGTSLPPIVALHGQADPIVSVELDRESARRVKEAGGTVELREYPGREHVIAPEMQRDWFDGIRAVLSP